jgi:serine/threonine-protein kinase
MDIDTKIELTNYLLLDELSQNSVVTVYRGMRKADQAPVVLKVIASLFAADEFFARRLKQSTRQTAKLEHPNIIRSHEAQQEGDWLYVVEELDLTAVRPLAQVLAQEGSFSLRRTDMIARQIASALDYAHQKSVTHGDLSAQQVYLGSNDEVFITDFGQTQAIFGVNLMRQGYPANSPEILAPERVHGQGPSRHADLYALGILCYQMLSGRPPFTGSPAAVLHAHAHKQPRPLYLVNPGIPIAVSDVIERMLAKGMELRYHTGAEFARALAMASENIRGASARPSLRQPSQYRPVSGRASAIMVSGVALLTIALTIGLVYAGYQLGMSQQPGLAEAPAALVVAGSITPTQPVKPTLTPRPSATLIRASVSDTLLPPQTTASGLATPTPLPSPVTPSATPTSTPIAPKPSPAATATPAIPAGQALLVFTNPTGHDLIVDLTGPSNASQLVPPYQRQEFKLSPGRYQMILHTPTGKFLASRTLEFEAAAGQTVQRDYYTNFDAQTAQLGN